MLERHGVARVVDVRRFPGSRRMPHFAKDALASVLFGAGIDYVHEPALGGRRKPAADSPNTGWRSSAFRGYADHMAGAEFAEGLERLESWSRERATAIMCAEGLWWRCHRRLIADALVSRGWRVAHLGTGGTLEDHALTLFAAAKPGEPLVYGPGGPASEG
jgi:uncharacterized protein (DUF488 family)